MWHLLICSPFYDEYGPYRVYHEYDVAKNIGERWVKLHKAKNNNTSTTYKVESIKVKILE